MVEKDLNVYGERTALEEVARERTSMLTWTRARNDTIHQRDANMRLMSIAAKATP